MHENDYTRDLVEFSRLAAGDSGIALNALDFVPCLDESGVQVTYNHRYLLHVGWAARILAETNPAMHFDIGSCSYFVTIASAFLNVIACDIRPMDIPLSELTTRVEDLTKLTFSDNAIRSLSCMHAMEHVGLGRYGDPIDPYGDQKAARELSRSLAPGGNLLMVLPVGRPKIAFNAHRIYSYQKVTEMFSGLRLKEFSFVPGELPYRFIKNADPAITADEDEGAGCFWFVK
jgi:hypothetical protein